MDLGVYIISPALILVTLIAGMRRMGADIPSWVVLAGCIAWGVSHLNPFNAMMLPNVLSDPNTYANFRVLLVFAYMAFAIAGIYKKSVGLRNLSHAVLVVVFADAVWSHAAGRYAGPQKLTTVSRRTGLNIGEFSEQQRRWREHWWPAAHTERCVEQILSISEPLYFLPSLAIGAVAQYYVLRVYAKLWAQLNQKPLKSWVHNPLDSWQALVENSPVTRSEMLSNPMDAQQKITEFMDNCLTQEEQDMWGRAKLLVVIAFVLLVPSGVLWVSFGQQCSLEAGHTTIESTRIAYTLTRSGNR